jgi:hypothetical protein
MDGSDEELSIPESAEFDLDGLDFDHADVVETDDDGLAWLAQNDLPGTVEGVDYSVGVDGGEAMA